MVKVSLRKIGKVCLLFNKRKREVKFGSLCSNSNLKCRLLDGVQYSGCQWEMYTLLENQWSVVIKCNLSVSFWTEASTLASLLPADSPHMWLNDTHMISFDWRVIFFLKRCLLPALPSCWFKMSDWQVPISNDRGHRKEAEPMNNVGRVHH